MTKYILLKIKYLWAILLLLAGLAATSCSDNQQTKISLPQLEQKEIWATLYRAFRLDLSRFNLNFALEEESPTETKDIWQTLSHTFRLEQNHPQVEKHIKKLLQNKMQLQKLIEYAEPYLYYVLHEVKKRDLPGELALIPIVESAFDPFAQSNVGAVGLWQLMPATSSDLGVTRDWWFDGRRDIYQSTQASLEYFEYLNKFFKGNWTLAIAAYNAGQGRVQNAINKNHNKGKSTNYWSLPLPKETKNYVPKLYALAKIIQNPERYNVNLPFIPNKPYFKFIKLDSPIELAKAAKLADMNLRDFKDLNPGHKQWLTKPEATQQIAVPVEKVPAFKENLKKLSEKEELLNWHEHRVKKGESIQKIAKNYHMPKEMLKEVNQVATKVKPGETLWIPKPSAATNKSSNEAYVKLGSISDKSVKPTPKKAPSKKGIRYHKVKSGESLGSIARKYQISLKKLKRVNGNKFTKKGKIRAGQRIMIPA